MLSLRAKIKDKMIEFIDELNLTGEHRVIVTFLDTDVVSVLFPEHDHDDAVALLGSLRFGLTERELDVLRLLRDGLNNEKIAEKLEISHGTARNYLSSVYEKLKVKNRTGALTKAIELGLLEK